MDRIEPRTIKIVSKVDRWVISENSTGLVQQGGDNDTKVTIDVSRRSCDVRVHTSYYIERESCRASCFPVAAKNNNPACRLHAFGKFDETVLPRHLKSLGRNPPLLSS